MNIFILSFSVFSIVASIMRTPEEMHLKNRGLLVGRLKKKEKQLWKLL